MMTTEEKKCELEKINKIERILITELVKRGMAEGLRDNKHFCVNEMILAHKEGEPYYNDGLKKNYIYYYMTKKQLTRIQVYFDGKTCDIDIQTFG